MKFTVEIEEFYLDEDEDLIPELKNYVVREVMNMIWQKVREKVEKSVVDPLVAKIKNNADSKISETFNEELTQILKSKSFKPNSYSKEVTFEEYIENSMGRVSIEQSVKKLADEHAKSVKDRYDLLFATQIVSRLSEQGMLKEDVARMLIEK